MPATVLIQNAMAYSGRLAPIRSRATLAPPEGQLSVAASFLWTVDGVAPQYAVTIHLDNMAPQKITQIVSLYIDNLNNDADVFFFFPDTQFRCSCPSNTIIVLPVITNGNRFTAYSPGSTDGNQTFVQILNFVPPPISATKSAQASPAVISGNNLPTNTTPVRVPITTMSGDVVGFYISLEAAGASGPAALTISLVDHSTPPVTIFQTSVLIPTTAANIVVVAPTFGMEIPVTGGVDLIMQSSSSAINSGFIIAGVYEVPK